VDASLAQLLVQAGAFLYAPHSHTTTRSPSRAVRKPNCTALWSLAPQEQREWPSKIHQMTIDLRVKEDEVHKMALRADEVRHAHT
jgi:hypothetical protein